MTSQFIPIHPRYVLNIVPERVLIPKCLFILGFGIVLYAIIFINYFLNRLRVPLVTYIIIGTGVLVLLCLEAIWTHMRYQNFKYEFYADHILVRGFHTYQIGYAEISSIAARTSFLDTFTKTATILLNNPEHRYMLKYIPKNPQVYSFVEQTIAQGRRQGFERQGYP